MRDCILIGTLNIQWTELGLCGSGLQNATKNRFLPRRHRPIVISERYKYHTVATDEVHRFYASTMQIVRQKSQEQYTFSITGVVDLSIF
jgi:hypothetical protein